MKKLLESRSNTCLNGKKAWSHEQTPCDGLQQFFFRTIKQSEEIAICIMTGYIIIHIYDYETNILQSMEE